MAFVCGVGLFIAIIKCVLLTHIGKPINSDIARVSKRGNCAAVEVVDQWLYVKPIASTHYAHIYIEKMVSH